MEPGALRVSLHDGVEAVRPRDCDFVVLDLALQELEQQDPRQARIVELRYFEVWPN
jgi:hypothetical protein